MGTRVWDATCYIADSDTLQTSDSDYHTLLISGSTVRICTGRNPLSNDTGYLGELCVGSISGTTYLYHHNGTSWVRVAFSSY